MPKGKYTRKTEYRRSRLKGKVILLAALAVLLFAAATGAVQGTLAYLFTGDEPVQNVFAAGEVEIGVVGEDSAVTVQNLGNVDAYVRAMIVVTWQDSAGKVYPVAPVENVDYTISRNSDDWTAPGGNGSFYTYKEEVAPNAYTAVLFSDCAAIADRAPEGCQLVVDVIAEAVQADDYGLAAWNS